MKVRETMPSLPTKSVYKDVLQKKGNKAAKGKKEKKAEMKKDDNEKPAIENKSKISVRAELLIASK